MAAPVLTQLAVEQAAERVAYLATRSTLLAAQLRELEDAIVETHAALRDASTALRAMREASDVAAGVE